MTIPPQLPEYVNFFKPFHFTAGDQLVVPIGASHISLRLQENTIKGVGGKRTNEQNTWVNSRCKRGVMQHSAFPVCICRLTLAWISCETSTKLPGMPTYPDRSSSLLWTLSHANSSLCCPVSTAHSRHPSPTAFFDFLCPTPFSRSLTHFRSRRDLESKTLCLVSRQNRQRDRLLGGPPT